MPTLPQVHEHKGNTCPVTGKGHDWCRVPSDSRSVCPALNTLANHGYLPRDGKNISVFDLIRGLREGYNLSFPLATFLSIGGFFLLRRVRNVSLFEIGRHNYIEHDASLVHFDTPSGHEYAPIEIHGELVDLLMRDAEVGNEKRVGKNGGDRIVLMDATDVAHARIRREKMSPPLDPVHAEIARGEMGIILGVWEVKDGSNAGIPLEWMRGWIQDEKLPEGWKPSHVQGLLDVVRRSKMIRTAMEEERKAEGKEEQES